MKDKLFALLEELLKDAKINTAFKPIIANLAKSFLKDADEIEIRNGVVKLRDEIIPWVLGSMIEERVRDEDTS